MNKLMVQNPGPWRCALRPTLFPYNIITSSLNVPVEAVQDYLIALCHGAGCGTCVLFESPVDRCATALFPSESARNRGNNTIVSAGWQSKNW